MVHIWGAIFAMLLPICIKRCQIPLGLDIVHTLPIEIAHQSSDFRTMIKISRKHRREERSRD